MTKKGFTLIELLAVIVILAIIALIAVPIVLGIIEDARKSATLRSAEFYLDGVEQAVARAMLNGVAIDSDKQYPIMKSGDICLGNYVETDQDGKESCKYEDGDDATLKVEVDGQKPTGGAITLSSGSISEATLNLNNKDIELKDGKLDYTGGGLDDNKESLIGKTVSFNPGDQVRIWYIIGETDTTVDLFLNENIGVSYWNTEEYSNDDGPIVPLTTLNALTINWKNVDPIASYIYINNENGTQYDFGYQRLVINNGITTIINKDNNPVTVEGISYARILSLEEYFDIAAKLNPTLEPTNLENIFKENFEAMNSAAGNKYSNFDEMLEDTKDASISRNKDINLIWLARNMWKQGYDYQFGYDFSFPSALSINLTDDGSNQAYNLLTTPLDYVAASIAFDKNISKVMPCVMEIGIRPVITVDKSEITILE